MNRFMLLSHFLDNQIARKPVRISCHIIACWYELTVQFCWSSTCMVEWPSSLGNGVLFCASRFKAHYLKTKVPSAFGLGSFPPRPELPHPPRKVIGK